MARGDGCDDSVGEVLIRRGAHDSMTRESAWSRSPTEDADLERGGTPVAMWTQRERGSHPLSVLPFPEWNHSALPLVIGIVMLFYV